MIDLPYWLLLLKAPLVGIKTFYNALRYFESPKNIFTSTNLIRQKSQVFKQKTLNWLENASLDEVAADLEWCKGSNCHIITIIDKEYPPLLKEIADPPPLLFVIGDLAVLSMPQMAIVGSRAPSVNGLDNSYYFAKRLVANNIVITSGLALGIDAKAHIGAIDGGGKTIAVCGTGLDRVYPARHKNLAHQIAINGAIVSEFAIGVAPRSNNFPKRNRIISGLSLGVLVVEATLKSGSLITARQALEQGREVFAIPSVIYNEKAYGCHHLIKQGAYLTENVEDILVNIGIDNISNDNQLVATDDKKNLNTQTDILLKYISYEPVSIDDLVIKTGLGVQVISEKLLLLELAGKVYNTANVGFALSNPLNK